MYLPQQLRLRLGNRIQQERVRPVSARQWSYCPWSFPPTKIVSIAHASGNSIICPRWRRVKERPNEEEIALAVCCGCLRWRPSHWEPHPGSSNLAGTMPNCRDPTSPREGTLRATTHALPPWDCHERQPLLHAPPMLSATDYPRLTQIRSKPDQPVGQHTTLPRPSGRGLNIASTESK
jgi:hypothetical protein